VHHVSDLQAREEVVYGDVTTGTESDLDNASNASRGEARGRQE